GYGRVIGRALYTCKRLYARLLCMASESDPFTVTPVPLLPNEEELNCAKVQELTNRIRETIDKRTNRELVQDREAFNLMSDIGPDQNILAYAFNFRLGDGSINSQLSAANKLNKEIYRILSIRPGSDIYAYRLIVSTTDLSESTYGKQFI